MIKNCLALILAICFASSPIAAQWSVGPKAGINFSHAQAVGLSFGIRPDIKWKAGGQAGIIGEYRFNEMFSVFAEVNYTEKGFITSAKYDFDIQNFDLPIGVQAEMRLRYIDVPLMVKYTVYRNDAMRAYVSGGAYFGYGINGNLKTQARILLDFNLTNTPINLANKSFDRTEFGAAIGGGIELNAGPGKFIIDARYSHAYNPLVDDFIVDVRLRNRGFSLGLGYTYTFAKKLAKA